MRKILVLWLLILGLGGCSAVITEPVAVSEPRTVQVLKHGRHSSLLLTAADESRVRYAYGDWAWYVDQQQGLWSGTRALTVPTRAALGRQFIAAAQPGERLATAVGVGIGEVYEFSVEGARVDALLLELDRQFNESKEEPHYSDERKLSFVTHPRPYTFRHNSNHAVAQWLEELGIGIRGNPALGNWEFAAD